MTNPDGSRKSATGEGPRDAWIAKRVDEALPTCPATDGVVSAIKQHLAGTMRERALSSAELVKLSKALIAATSDSPTEESGE
jgi:hypothetical protein